MWDLVPWPGIKPGPLHWQVDSYPLCPQGRRGSKLLCTIFYVDMLPFLLGIYRWKTSFEDPLEKGMATCSSILAGEFHGQRSPVGHSPWSQKELDTTEQLTHTHTHTYDLFLTLRRTGRLFSKVTAPFYIPADSVWGLQFFHIHPNTYLSFDCNHPSGCEMLSLWSCFAFLWKLTMLSVFSCLLATCIPSFEEMVLCPIFS